MIHLDYSLEPAELRRLKGVDLASATRTQLDYYLFCGNVVFRIDDAVFDASWGWVPILDFAARLYELVHDLRNSTRQYLEFTESEARISLHLRGDRVEVTTNYVPSRAETSLDALQEVATAFLHRVLKDLRLHWPDIARNPAFREFEDMIT